MTFNLVTDAPISVETSVEARETDEETEPSKAKLIAILAPIVGFALIIAFLMTVLSIKKKRS